MSTRTLALALALTFGGIAAMPHTPAIDEISAVQPAGYASLHAPPTPRDQGSLLAFVLNTTPQDPS